MHEPEQERNAALVELQTRLADGLARTRLSKTQLATQARLSRTTVQMAFQPDAIAAPSAQTVVALARVLRLPEKELLDLRRVATEGPGPICGTDEAPGKPISDWDPHDLEVHPAGPAFTGGRSKGLTHLSGYVMRDHDRILAEAVRDAAGGRSRMVVLVGSSSTGKTRACWEAVQPLASRGWRLWHPFDPTRSEAALEGLQRVSPCTVVWLNEAQHYLGNPGLGEQVAAAIHSLLTEPARGPILVLGTLWPDFADEYTDLTAPGQRDRYSRVRELLAGRTLTVPDSFDEPALQAAASLAKNGDQLLADALTRATAGGRVAQHLAGAPELLRRYEQGTPAAKALLEAAMDGRRLGIGLHLPQSFLIDAASDYLSDDDFDHLMEDWAEASFADLARPVHGKQAPLRRTGARPDRRPPGSPPGASQGSSIGPMFRLADYLEQHGRKARRAKCPPDSFWHAAYTHLARPEDLNDLAESALDRHRLRWAYHLHQRAADLGDPSALVYMGRMQESFGRGKEAAALFRQAAESGDSNALLELAFVHQKCGARQEAYSLFRLAAEAGNKRAVIHLVFNLVDDGDWEGAEAVASPALDRGYPLALYLLAEQRERVGDSVGAASLYHRAAEAGESRALVDLVRLRRQAGDREGAEALEKQVAAAGKPHELYSLAVLRDAVGESAAAMALIRQAVGVGDFAEIFPLVAMRLQAGDREGAEELVAMAADAGDARALTYLAQLRDDSGSSAEAEELARRAADDGDTVALCFLATRREEAGDFEGAETLYRQAIEVGDESALAKLARRREEVGDQQGADAYYRLAANAGKAQHLQLGARWPHGLDADGVPTAPWL
ncbi:hypothetical protein GCM10010345_57700 [Streptomyces canarius]|uniref:HTH cro/C1-type domain-containing protein n=1 Tax=Streptomyces canarius TaxID=285453 RepID=A0ABQ3CWV5_9ACTN|nr:hypothetical protein GCM10010345_57700 [Streptomyces canarius]